MKIKKFTIELDKIKIRKKQSPVTKPHRDKKNDYSRQSFKKREDKEL